MNEEGKLHNCRVVTALAPPFSLFSLSTWTVVRFSGSGRGEEGGKSIPIIKVQIPPLAKARKEGEAVFHITKSGNFGASIYDEILDS